jgi:hypothetical protein
MAARLADLQVSRTWRVRKQLSILLGAAAALYAALPTAEPSPFARTASDEPRASAAVLPAPRVTRAAPSPRSAAPAPVRADHREGPTVRVEPNETQDAESARKTELERTWSREPADSTWTEQLQIHIDSAIGDLAIDAEVRQVACGTSLCRVDLKLASAEAGRQMQELVADDEQRREIFFGPSEDGVGLDVNVYVIRR